MTRTALQSSWALLLSPLLLACVSTNVADTRDLPVCAVQLDSAPVADAMVQINVDAQGLSTFCNGTVIAPNLVLTEANCVAIPYVEFDFTLPSCRATGAPVEDGSFEFRYSRIADPSSISLLGKTDPLASMVAEVFVSQASSPCMPDIAVLQVQPELNAPVAPLRLEGNSIVDEEVTITGFDLTGPTAELHETDSTVADATSEVGGEKLPPRSMLLSGNACTVEGGAVFASTTSALIGVIQQSDLNISCDTGTGHPVAVQLPPFREFLLDTARQARTTLVAERRAGVPSVIPDCPR